MGHEPGVAAQRPTSIEQAVKLMYVGAAISLIGVIVTLLTSGSLRTQIHNKLATTNSTLTTSQVDTAVTAVIAIGVVLGLVGVGLWLWMAAANGRGRSWARVVATVLGVLNVLSLVSGLAQGQYTSVTAVINVISVLLAVAILVLIWRPDSTAFYRAQSGRQAY